MLKKHLLKSISCICFALILPMAFLLSSCSSNKKSEGVESRVEVAEETKVSDDNEVAKVGDGNEKSAKKRGGVFYLKGDNLYMIRYDNSEIIDFGTCTNNGSVKESFSFTAFKKPEKAFICSFSDYDGETYSLYKSPYDTPTDRTKIADKVKSHQILANGNILYLLDNDLFLYKDGKAKSIFKEEKDMEYIISKEEDKLLVLRKGNRDEQERGNMYLIDIDTGEDTVFEDVDGRNVYYSSDLNTIYEIKDDAIYLFENGKQREIVKGIKFPYNIFDIADEKIIYASKTDEPSSLYKIGFDGKEELISDSFVQMVTVESSPNLLAYMEENPEGKMILKLKIDDETVGEYEGIGDSKFDYVKGRLLRNSKYLYVFSQDSKKLWRIGLEGDLKGEIELVNENLSNLSSFAYKKDRDALLYQARVGDNKYDSLFLDEEVINENVGTSYVGAGLEEGKNGDYIVYRVYSGSGQTEPKESYDLHIWENGEDSVFLKNIFDYSGYFGSDNKFENTYFLTDYDYGKGVGTLEQYVNGEFKEVDNDVKRFVRNQANILGGEILK